MTRRSDKILELALNNESDMIPDDNKRLVVYNHESYSYSCMLK